MRIVSIQTQLKKLSLVREAATEGASIVVVNSKRIIEKKLDLTIYPEIKISLDEPLRYVLDTREMKKRPNKCLMELNMESCKIKETNCGLTYKIKTESR